MNKARCVRHTYHEIRAVSITIAMHERESRPIFSQYTEVIETGTGGTEDADLGKSLEFFRGYYIWHFFLLARIGWVALVLLLVYTPRPGCQPLLPTNCGAGNLVSMWACELTARQRVRLRPW